jgi:hypothetical protein
MDNLVAQEVLGYLKSIDGELQVIRKAILSLALRQSDDDQDHSKAQRLLEEVRPRAR